MFGTVLLLSLRVASAAEAEQADALFHQGLEEMRAGRYETGCRKLERSYQLDPLPGALFTVAECDAAWGKVATALERYQLFLTALTRLPPERRDSFDERRSVALAKITALSTTVPSLEINLASGASGRPIVRCNGKIVPAQSFGVTKKVDPGEYVITAELDGNTIWRRSVVLAKSDHADVLVPWPTGKPRPSLPADPRSSPKPSTKSRDRAPIALYASVGVGAAGVLVGTIAGSIALSKKSTIDDNCQDRLCNEKGRDAVDSAKSAATVSTVGFAVAGVGVGTALVLLLTGSRQNSKRDTAWIGSYVSLSANRGVGLSLEGKLP